MQDETIKNILDNINQGIEKINKKIDEMNESISCLGKDYIRHDEQIKMIKERNEKKDAQLASIIRENEQQHNNIIKEQDKLKRQQYIWSGALIIIAFFAKDLINLILKK